ncbi:MAG: acetoin utilization protein AcuC [Thermoanaerobaculia bacterium]
MPSVIYRPEYREYAFGETHPFRPRRVDMTLDLLESLGHPLRFVEAPAATREEILDVHEDYYVRRVEDLSEGREVPDRRDYGLDTADTPAFLGMDRAARYHVGGTLHGARLITGGSSRRVLQLGGGLHHARRNFASGFCIYNDLAVAIRHFAREGLWVLYVDVDVHHGDGVQQILDDDKRVLTVSIHESGKFLFPGSGGIHELGSGLGRGLKLNLPLAPFTEGPSYLEVFEQVTLPALNYFRPGVLVVQAGADAHFDDELADLRLTTCDYEAIFRRLLAWADEFTAGRVLFTLGGGYSLRAVPRVWALLYLLIHEIPIPETLPADWCARWSDSLGDEPSRSFHDDSQLLVEIPDRDAISAGNREAARRLLEAASPYWI